MSYVFWKLIFMEFRFSFPSRREGFIVLISFSKKKYFLIKIRTYKCFYSQEKVINDTTVRIKMYMYIYIYFIGKNLLALISFTTLLNNIGRNCFYL